MLLTAAVHYPDQSLIIISSVMKVILYPYPHSDLHQHAEWHMGDHARRSAGMAAGSPAEPALQLSAARVVPARNYRERPGHQTQCGQPGTQVDPEAVPFRGYGQR